VSVAWEAVARNRAAPNASLRDESATQRAPTPRAASRGSLSSHPAVQLAYSILWTAAAALPVYICPGGRTSGIQIPLQSPTHRLLLFPCSCSWLPAADSGRRFLVVFVLVLCAWGWTTWARSAWAWIWGST
jgi:hypothetical protein